MSRVRRRDSASSLPPSLAGEFTPVPPPRRFRRARAAVAFVAGTAAVGAVAGLLVAPAAMAGGAGVVRAADMWQAIEVEVPFDAALPQRSVMVDRNGQPFATLFAEDRIPVTRDQLAPVFVDALLSTEDSRFYEHGGVDLLGTGRAILNNVVGGPLQGASTITQQWVKNLTQAAADTPEKRQAADDVSIGRKLVEARAAAEAEARFSKDEILTRYVNTAFYGAGAYGIGAASARYFSTTPDKLTLNEAALLAGVLNSPSLFDPLVNPEKALGRRNVVLDRMVEEGTLAPEAAAFAKAQPLALSPSVPPNGCATSAYPFYCQWIRDEISTNPAFGPTPAAREELLYRGGLRIQTALDPAVQQAADAAASAAFEPTNRVAAAVAVVQPGSGEVLALAANRPWGSDVAAGQTENIYPAMPAFPPGSTFKPITLAAAVETGFDPKTIWNAPTRYTPAELNAPEGGFANSDDGPGGIMTAEQATWRSVNTYYVWLEERTGVIPVAQMAQRLGMTSIRTEGQGAVGERDASLTLGTFNTSPLQLANVYATFASGGVRCNPVGVTSLVRDGAEELPVAGADCAQAIDPTVAAKVNAVLLQNIDGPDPFRTASGASIGRAAIGKTGTGGDHAAATFAGATPQMAAAVWVGDPRGGVANPLFDVTAYGDQFLPKVYGGQVPARIWKDTMAKALEGAPVLQFPAASKAPLPTVQVPNVAGLPIDSAVGVLTAAGFTVRVAPTTEPAAQALPPDYVVATTPAAGTPRKTGTPVVLTLSPGSRTDVQVRQSGE